MATREKLDALVVYGNALARTRASAGVAGSKELEHQFRPALKELIEAILPGTQALNEPGKSEFGMPDFALVKNSWPVGYVETKRLGVDLDEIVKGEQLKRYFGYANLVLTNYVEFRFYKHGDKYCEPIIIANADTLVSDIAAGELLKSTFAAFLEEAAEPVRRAETLAKIMGENAKRLRGNLLRFLKNEDARNRPILDIYDVFKTQLIHDLTIESFTDMYAQTLVYGFFVARYHDETLKTFDRREARDLIPATNPLLRRFFDHITGADFDVRLEPIVNELCKVFENADVRELMRQLYRQDLWGGTQAGPDPVVHFYEDFLREYDADQRKRLGAFYTPPPVVRFIVRSVDAVLKRDFNLAGGLADTSKTEITRVKSGKQGRETIHKVQVLDPATGTGTFLTEVIRHIRESFNGQEGRFAQYVNDDLLPRIHGFELMMAPYTIAHLKIGATLAESGAKNLVNRLGIYLTNSLEQGTSDDGSLFNGLGLSQAISNEAREASVIKNETPIMVVIGNPPYSGESNNALYTGHDVYKVEPTGGKLKERNSKWINDDYVKFIRLAESMVEKTGEGIIAMITAHGYIDNPTFRGMRWHLRSTFDEIYILDLHGSARKKETSLDGSKDENVFDIMSGVSILFGIKKENNKKKTPARIYKADLYGSRKEKFFVLENKSFEDIAWTRLPDDCDIWKVEGENKEEYNEGFSVNELFPVSSVGVVTGRDAIAISEEKALLKRNIIAYANNENFEYEEEKAIKINYRPFDTRCIYYDKKFIERGRWNVMQHFVNEENIGLIFKRGGIEEKSAPVFVSGYISESRSWSRPGMQGIESLAPLYLFPEINSKYSAGEVGGIEVSRVPNIDLSIARKIANIIGYAYYPVAEYDSKEGDTRLTPEDIFDYVYAVLHSQGYCDRYKEFLKIDFPRVPYPKSGEAFDALAKLGKELRELHLLNSPKVRQYITSYPEGGSNLVEKIERKGDKIYINVEQYFGGVPETAWNFYIGGYQPAQKWLKDRKGRALSNEDIEHYQQMIVSLTETGRIMGEIDKVV